MSEDVYKVYQSNAAKLIKELRERKGLSQGAIGTQIGRSSTFISNFEGKKESHALEDYCKLAKVFDLHPLELLTGIPRDVIELTEQLTALDPSERERRLKLFRLVTEIIELF